MEEERYIPDIIQELAFLNKMVNMLGEGTRGINMNMGNGRYVIEAQKLPQWALDLLYRNIKNALDYSKIEIDELAKSKFDKKLQELKNT